MQVTRKSRLHLRAQNIIFVFLLLAAAGLVAWLSEHYTWQADWSAGNRNSLSDASRELLDTLDAPIAITAFARETPALRQQINNLVQRYQRSYESVSLTFVNPDTHSAQARELGITLDGELIVHYAGKSEHVRQLNEAAITNALQRLAREINSRILFVTGHGERLPPGNARNNQGSRNFDLGSFGQRLIETGFTLDTINLAKAGTIPDNTSFMVIAGPQADYLPAEVQTLQTWLANGGNLLWLAEPGSDRHGLAPLADTLGIQFLPGLVIDATSKLFGVSDPSMILVPRYPDTPLTHDFNLLTVYPQVTGLAITDEETTAQKSSWESMAFLRTLPRAWQETGDLKKAVAFNPETADQEGPLTIGIALTRTVSQSPEEYSTQNNAANTLEKTQRVVVTGDGDFLTNAYLGNGGNLALGLNLVNWLSHDDAYINITPHSAPDTRLVLSRVEILSISIFFLIALPLTLLATGIVIWWRRRRA